MKYNAADNLFLNSKDIYCSLLKEIPETNVSLRELEVIVAKMFETVSNNVSKKIERGYDYFSVDSSITLDKPLSNENKNYTMFNSFSSASQKYDLKKLIQDLTMAYYSLHGGKEFAKIPDLTDAIEDYLSKPIPTPLYMSRTIPFKCTINGIELSKYDIQEISDYFDASLTAAFVMGKYGLTGEQALEVGFLTNSEMRLNDCDKNKALSIALEELHINEPSEPEEEPDDEPEV